LATSAAGVLPIVEPHPANFDPDVAPSTHPSLKERTILLRRDLKALGTAALLDHLVGDREQRRRHGKAEHTGALDVDDQFEFGRLRDR
jgi:hypothetical protein